VKEIEEDILRENVKYLLDEYYDGNVSEMQRQTGANRSVISELKNGTKSEVNSSTLRHFAEAGININWLLTGEGPHFVIGNEEELKTELKQKQLLVGRTSGAQTGSGCHVSTVGLAKKGNLAESKDYSFCLNSRSITVRSKYFRRGPV
jgi:hypothetical protein